MALQLEPPVPPPRRSVSTRCDLHPGENFTGFCAACLRERLSGLEEASAAAAAAPGRRSTSAIRSLFSRPPFAAAPSCATAAVPDLRRCKSFSCGGRGGDALALGGGDEPQRRSCDVRGRSTLWALFHQDDRERVRDGTAFGAFPASSSAAAAALAAEVQHPPHPPPPVCVPEEFLAEEIAVAEDSDEITPVVEPVSLAVDTSGSVEMDTEATAARDVRAMKDHIDLESAQPHQPKKPPPKDLKEIAGSFWLAASVFSKKWQKLKQKLKKQDAVNSKAAAAAMPAPEKPPKPSSFLRRSRVRGEADFAVGGRRSCDTDPTRFSLDAGRMSVDDAAGVSWDEPRASWDGYLFGPGVAGLGRTPQRVVSRLPPILSALEDSPAGVVERSDGQIPVEDDSQPEFETDANVPGGSAQTREYYMDSSSRRRRSLDRASSSSARRSVDVAVDPKPPVAAVPVPVVSNSPLVVGGSEFYHLHHAEDLLDHHRLSTSSLVEDFSASLEAAFHGPPAEKKPRHHRWRKAWSLWGLIHRRASGRRTDVADRAFSETRVRGYGNARMQRCSSNASARSSFSSNSGGLGSSRRSCGYDGHVKRRRGEGECGGALERNRSARVSPGHADNGMLRFYLTPMRSASGRRTPGRQLRSQSFARTMLRLY